MILTRFVNSSSVLNIVFSLYFLTKLNTYKDVIKNTINPNGIRISNSNIFVSLFCSLAFSRGFSLCSALGVTLGTKLVVTLSKALNDEDIEALDDEDAEALDDEDALTILSDSKSFIP